MGRNTAANKVQSTKLVEAWISAKVNPLLMNDPANLVMSNISLGDVKQHVSLLQAIPTSFVVVRARTVR
jgi:hypothetical protein